MSNMNEISELPENLEEEGYSNEFDRYVTYLKKQREQEVGNIINK